MNGGDRLIDTNVLVHAYVFLDAKKHASAREIILPMWHEGGGLTTLQNLCEFFAVVTGKVQKPMPVAQESTPMRTWMFG
ncbi:MAG: hypothetical protein HY726_18380 [Candidatus Rokubacteria bacterium]|nr:hypothetical protein [Candidatus Rokubacteria bacterium]